MPKRERTISFDVTNAERVVIKHIARRARTFWKTHAAFIDIKPPSLQHFEMDIMACHANGCRLDLLRLLDADDFTFSHDVFGIYRHIDRDDNSPTGGMLLNCFLPRCAMR